MAYHTPFVTSARRRAGLPAGTMPSMARVLIVDDHSSFRAIARRILSRAGHDVVGEAVDGRSGLAAVRRLRPDAVLLDVGLPDADGVQLASALRGEEDPPVVVLTSSRDRRDLEPVLRRSTARGFLHKEELTAAALAELIG
jgi:DNA-binding NarL/FixJ family response regulator